MNTGFADCGEHYPNRNPQADTSPQEPTQQEDRGQAKHASGKGSYRLETVPAVELGEPHIREPLPGEPRLAGPGEREEVLEGDFAGLENVVSRADMPTGIAIGKQPLPRQRASKRGQHEDQEEQIYERRFQQGTPPLEGGGGQI